MPRPDSVTLISLFFELIPCVCVYMVLKKEPGDLCMLGKFCAMIETGSQCGPVWPFSSYLHVLASKVAGIIDVHHQGSDIL